MREGRGVVARERPEGAAGGDVGADGGAEDGEEDDEEEAEGATVAGGGLVVDGGEGEVGGVEDVRDVGDGVEDGDHVEEGGEEADDHLRGDGEGDVALGAGDFFGEVGNAAGSADCVGAVEHACQEDEAVRCISRLVIPIAPDERRICVSRASCVRLENH